MRFKTLICSSAIVFSALSASPAFAGDTYGPGDVPDNAVHNLKRLLETMDNPLISTLSDDKLRQSMVNYCNARSAGVTKTEIKRVYLTSTFEKTDIKSSFDVDIAFNYLELMSLSGLVARDSVCPRFK